jgi:homogentisate 1,2-dioxygenase
MKRYINFPRSAGKFSRQAHCAIPDDTYECEFGREGFSGPCSHVYHSHKPTGWVSWEGDLRPYAFDLNKMGAKHACPFSAPVVTKNATCSVRFWHCASAMEHLVTNADGDELLFIHSGAGDLFCDFGHMAYKSGDYIVLPRGLKWRITPSEPCEILIIESKYDGYCLPDKGMVGPHAVFDETLLDVPELNEAFEDQKDEKTWHVRMRRGDALATVTYPFNPLDTVGWKGDNLPVRINWRDIRPLMSHRYHLPPSAHTTFIGNRFIVCTFVPRPAEMSADALKVPFYHANNDFDEFIFYHAGQFFSRDNIHPGMATLHPCGFTHGPHPKAFELAKQADANRKPSDPVKMLDEVAVMIDTRDALQVTNAALSVENADYPLSWKTPEE